MKDERLNSLDYLSELERFLPLFFIPKVLFIGLYWLKLLFWYDY